MVADRLGRLAYPVAGVRAERPLLACWILVLCSFLVPIVPLVPLVGYLVRVLVTSANGATEPPPFLDDAVALFRLALGASAVSIAYLTVPLVLLFVTVNGALQSGRAPDGFSTSLLFLGGSTVVFVVSLLASYLLPVALEAYGRERRLRAAFDRRTLWSTGRRASVLVGWATGVGIIAIGGSVASVLYASTRLGPVFAALCVAYALVLASHRVGIGIGRATR